MQFLIGLVSTLFLIVFLSIEVASAQTLSGLSYLCNGFDGHQIERTGFSTRDEAENVNLPNLIAEAIDHCSKSILGTQVLMLARTRAAIEDCKIGQALGICDTVSVVPDGRDQACQLDRCVGAFIKDGLQIHCKIDPQTGKPTKTPSGFCDNLEDVDRLWMECYARGGVADLDVTCQPLVSGRSRTITRARESILVQD